MAASSGGVSGLAVGVTAAGGLLLWSAIRNVSPLDTLREVLGKESNQTPISTPLASVASGVRTITGTAVGEAAGAAAAAGAGVAGSASGDAARLVAEARKMIGVPYVWASATSSGVDCSGLVVYCLRKIGIDCPRFTTATFGAWARSHGWAKVKPSAFRAGDVILRPGHMAIAISGTRMIAAPHVGSHVQEQSIYQLSTWWGYRMGAGSRSSAQKETDR